MKKIIPIIIIAVVAVLVLVLRGGGDKAREPVAGTPTEEPQAGSKVGTKIGNLAPEFELLDYAGNTVKLSDYRGQKPVFVNFWAAWCPFCVEEMPLMARVQKQFGNQYLTLAINRGEDQSTGQKFTDKLGITDTFVLLNDKSDTTYPRYGGFAMPYSLFLDKNGVVVDIKLGPLTESELVEKIEKILESK